MRKIDYRFKFLYVIGTLSIVIGHTGGTINLLYDWFPWGSWFLAIFAFSSGYFFDEDKCLNKLGSYVVHKMKTLIIPLYLYNLVYGLFVLITKQIGFSIGEDFTLYNLIIAPIMNGNQFVYNLASWYVVPLFFIQIFYAVVRKLLRMLKICYNEYIMFIFELVLGVLGVLMAQNGYNAGIFLVIVRTLYLVPFYGLGILYKLKLESKDKISNLVYFSILFVLKLIIITTYKRTLGYTVAWCNDFNENAVMPFVVGTIGIAFWLRVATILNPILKESKTIKIISDCSYSIMMNQFLGFMFVKTIYALLSVYTPLFPDFDMVQYMTNVWYYYFPCGIYNYGILYVAAGIVIPIFFQKFIDKIVMRKKKEQRVS